MGMRHDLPYRRWMPIVLFLSILCHGLLAGCRTSTVQQAPSPEIAVTTPSTVPTIAPAATETPIPTVSPSPTRLPTSKPTKTQGASEMAREVMLTVVYDNDAYTPSLKTAWGFGCFIEGMERTILFDTGGDAPTLLRNMRALEIDPQQVEVVVLSHIHSDHTGGLEGFLRRNAQVTVWMPASFPRRFDDLVARQGANMVRVREAQPVCEGVYSTGEMGRSTVEQGLVLDTDRGVVVITGCAHPGVADMVARAHEGVEGELLLVVGGFHLGSASRQRIESIISRFRALGVQYVGPTHCSGETAKRLFKEKYGENYLDVGAGREICLEDLD